MKGQGKGGASKKKVPPPCGDGPAGGTTVSEEDASGGRGTGGGGQMHPPFLPSSPVAALLSTHQHCANSLSASMGGGEDWNGEKVKLFNTFLVNFLMLLPNILPR